jgi:hypothetical protein
VKLLGQHIHFKDGKFNVWSTMVDAYVMQKWLPKDEFMKEYIATELYFKYKEILESMIEGMTSAETNNGCSIPYPTLRCTKI